MGEVGDGRRSSPRQRKGGGGGSKHRGGGNGGGGSSSGKVGAAVKLFEDDRGGSAEACNGSGKASEKVARSSDSGIQACCDGKDPDNGEVVTGAVAVTSAMEHLLGRVKGVPKMEISPLLSKKLLAAALKEGVGDDGVIPARSIDAFSSGSGLSPEEISRGIQLRDRLSRALGNKMDVASAAKGGATATSGAPGRHGTCGGGDKVLDGSNIAYSSMQQQVGCSEEMPRGGIVYSNGGSGSTGEHGARAAADRDVLSGGAPQFNAGKRGMLGQRKEEKTELKQLHAVCPPDDTSRGNSQVSDGTNTRVLAGECNSVNDRDDGDNMDEAEVFDVDASMPRGKPATAKFPSAAINEGGKANCKQVSLGLIATMDVDPCLEKEDLKDDDRNAPRWGTRAGENSAPNDTEMLDKEKCTQGVCGNVSLIPGEKSGGSTPTFVFGTGSQLMADRFGKAKALKSVGVAPSRLGAYPSAAAFPRQGPHTQSAGNTVSNVWERKQNIRVDSVEALEEFTMDGNVVLISPTTIAANRAKLANALVGKIVGKTIPFHVIRAELSKKWAHFGLFRLILVSIDCFVCIFDSGEARDKVLLSGPWFIAGQIVGMDSWHPSFSPNTLQGWTAPVWIRLPNFPLLFWDHQSILRVASMVGKPLWLDGQTSEWGRCSYARICVSLRLDQQLPRGVWVQGDERKFFQKVEYEGLLPLCLQCGHLGHRANSCPSSVEAKDKSQFATNSGAATNNDSRAQDIPSRPRPFDADQAITHTPGCSQSESIATPSPAAQIPDDCHNDGWTVINRRKQRGPKQLNRRAQSNSAFEAPSRKITKPSIAVTVPRRDISMQPQTEMKLSLHCSPRGVEGTQDYAADPTIPVHGKSKLDFIEISKVTTQHGDVHMQTEEARLHVDDPNSLGPDSIKAAAKASSSRELVPYVQSGRGRVSRAHLDREIQQLGPIEERSRKKRRNHDRDGSPKVPLVAQANRFQLLTYDGGDASPSTG